MSKQKGIFLSPEELEMALGDQQTLQILRPVNHPDFENEPDKIRFKFSGIGIDGNFRLNFWKGSGNNILAIQPEFSPGDLLWVKEAKEGAAAAKMKKEEARVWLLVEQAYPEIRQETDQVSQGWDIAYACKVLSNNGKPEGL